MSALPLWPPAASTQAVEVDRLFLGILAVVAFFAALIAVLVLALAARYREGRPADRTPRGGPVWALEAAWIAVPTLIVLVIFARGAVVFFHLRQAPPDAIEIFVVGKQWMWKLRHPNGKREINELHVPRGVAVKLVMTSQDVIHSLYIPAFRVKQDVLPGRYTSQWFRATRVGEYHLFCSEYCGTDHARMGGRVIVMEPAEYQRWLGPTAARPAGGGADAFERLGCSACHQPGSAERAPRLEGLYGSRVRLAGGRSVKADEAYLRESILDPRTKVVEGYKPLMPSFRGQLSDEELALLVAYIKGRASEKP